jgi:excisionase family DNA binding protein
MQASVDNILTLEEFAQLLKISPRTVYRMLEDSELPFAMKIKGSWRFKRLDVEAWLERQKIDHKEKGQ